MIRRFAGILFALFLLPGFLFAGFFFLLRRIFTGKPVFQTISIHAGNGAVLSLREFRSNSRILRNLPLCTALLSGSMQLTGVARRSAHVSCPPAVKVEKPGFFTMEFIRRGARIGFGGMDQADADWLSRRRSLRKDFALILRTLPALFFAAGKGAEEDFNTLFEVRYANMTMSGALETLSARVLEKSRARVFFMNPDCFNKVWKDRQYRADLEQSEYIFPDGIGLVIAGKLLGHPLRENINGTDMFPRLCQMAEEKHWSLYLLGAGEGVAQRAADAMQTRFPGLIVTGVRNGFFSNEQEERDAVEHVRAAAPDLLFVAMGVPRQERFINKNWEKLGCTLAFGVGGLFDFYSGRIPRAPAWMRECGLEWSYRLAQEPARMFKRYVIGNPVFLFRVAFWRGRLSAFRRKQLK